MIVKPILMAFNGIITHVKVSRNGPGAFTDLHISGNGFLILLDGASQIQVFENSSIQNIIYEKLDKFSSIAPGIKTINSLPNKMEIYTCIWYDHLGCCLIDIEEGNFKQVFTNFCEIPQLKAPLAPIAP